METLSIVLAISLAVVLILLWWLKMHFERKNEELMSMASQYNQEHCLGGESIDEPRQSGSHKDESSTSSADAPRAIATVLPQVEAPIMFKPKIKPVNSLAATAFAAVLEQVEQANEDLKPKNENTLELAKGFGDAFFMTDSEFKAYAKKLDVELEPQAKFRKLLKECLQMQDATNIISNICKKKDLNVEEVTVLICAVCEGRYKLFPEDYRFINNAKTCLPDKPGLQVDYTFLQVVFKKKPNMDTPQSNELVPLVF